MSAPTLRDRLSDAIQQFGADAGIEDVDMLDDLTDSTVPILIDAIEARGGAVEERR
jgi:hypothetical protein